jgi:GH18 family chitinase
MSAQQEVFASIDNKQTIVITCALVAKKAAGGKMVWHTTIGSGPTKVAVDFYSRLRAR